jgi:predicted Zn-dependent protease
MQPAPLSLRDNVWGVRYSLLLLLTASLLRTQPDALAAKSQEAKQLMAAGRFPEAAVLYEQLVKAVPGNPGLLLNLGMAQHMAGQDERAVQQFANVLKLQPNALPALLMGGASYLRLGQPARAVDYLKKAAALSPADKQGRQMLADGLVMLGRFEEAAPELRKLAEVDPSEPKVWHGLGRSYEALAQKSFERLQQAFPESGYLPALLAEAQLKQRRNTSAFVLYREALKKLPSERGLHAGLAGVYRAAIHPEWAAVEEKKEAALGPLNCGTKTLECRFRAGEFLAIASAPQSQPKPTAASLFWSTRAYNQLATEAFARLEALPPSLELHQFKADIYRNQGRHADSAKEWEAALNLSPRNARIERELVRSIYLSRDNGRAEPMVRALLSAEPRSAELNFFLGDILLAKQQLEAALPFLQRAVETDPKMIPAQAALGRALVQGGKGPEAIPYLQAALPIDEDGSLHYQLSRAFQAAGKPEEARKAMAAYQQAAKGRGAGPETEITAP